METNKIKPCPFCGAELIMVHDGGGRFVGWEHPYTYDCILGAMGEDSDPIYISVGQDSELWNTRTC